MIATFIWTFHDTVRVAVLALIVLAVVVGLIGIIIEIAWRTVLRWWRGDKC